MRINNHFYYIKGTILQVKYTTQVSPFGTWAAHIPHVDVELLWSFMHSLV